MKKKIYLIKVILIMMLVFFPKVGISDELTMGEMTTHIKTVLDGIDNISFKYILRIESQDSNMNDYRVLIESASWYKKPHMGRHEIAFMFGREKNDVSIYRAEGENFYDYHVSKLEGAVHKTQYSLDKWKQLDINFGRGFFQMNQLLESDTPHSMECNEALKKCSIHFTTDNNMIFYVRTDEWLIDKIVTQIDDELVVMIWEDIVINGEIDDKLFEVPSANVKRDKLNRGINRTNWKNRISQRHRRRRRGDGNHLRDGTHRRKWRTHERH